MDSDVESGGDEFGGFEEEFAELSDGEELVSD